MTFTLIARNPFTRQIGLAMASGSDDCIGGSLVAQAVAVADRPAMIVVQGKPDVALRGQLGEAYAQGQSIPALMQRLQTQDSALPLRQILMASFDAPLVVHTGAFCPAWAGQQSDEHLIVAGNMLANASVLRHMRKAYLRDLHAPMRRRLLAALAAGVMAGGDQRGHASAGIVTIGAQPFHAVITGHQQPLAELEKCVL